MNIRFLLLLDLASRRLNRIVGVISRPKQALKKRYYISHHSMVRWQYQYNTHTHIDCFCKLELYVGPYSFSVSCSDEVLFS